MNDEDKIIITRLWWEKSIESLNSAKREFDAGSLAYSVNRLYYSLFYAATAALFERGFSYKKHSAVRAAFHREFIKSGIMDKKWGFLFDILYESRHEGDYIAFIKFDPKEVESQYNECKQFLEIFKSLISSPENK